MSAWDCIRCGGRRTNDENDIPSCETCAPIVRLERLVDLIEARLAPLDEGHDPGAPTEVLVRRIDRNRAAAVKLIGELGAHYRDVGHECRLRLAGVATTCTRGPYAVLRNWQNAARRRIEGGGR
jgi:hypothetical protein